MISAQGGASIGLSCLQEECQWRGWSSFSSVEKGKVFHPGIQDGLVMTVLHETTGVVLLRKTFNTWHPYTHALDLLWWVKRLQAGRVVVLVVRGAGTYGLGDALPILTNLGSLLARHAPPRALLAWTFVVGGRTLLETVAPYHQSPNATLHAHFLLPAAPSVPVFPRSYVSASQERLCDSQAALGPLCDPVDPLVMPLLVVEAEQREEAEEVGVVVCAGGRFQYLAHTLVSLLHNHGLARSRVVVVMNGPPSSEVLTLLELLRLRHSVVNVSREAPSINHHLFQFYRGAWSVGVRTFPHARYLVFLDEDVEVSPDWLSLLLHLAPALAADPSLWCVSGSGPSNPCQYRDPRRVIRGARQPGWGFLVLAAEARAVVETWPNTSSVSLLYDTFLLKTVGRDRECVYPMLGRSRHYGIGVNTIPEIHYYYFLRLPMHDGSPASLPQPETLTQQQYETEVWARLRAAAPLSRNPCAPGFLRAPDDGSPTDLVFFFFMDNLRNSLEWAMLAECVGAWPYSTQAMHRGSVELPQAWGGSVWLVGVPASPYHTLRRPGVPVWRPTTDRQLEEQFQYFSSLRPNPNLTSRTLDAALTHLFLPASVPADDPTSSLARTTISELLTSLLPSSEATTTPVIADNNETNKEKGK